MKFSALAGNRTWCHNTIQGPTPIEKNGIYAYPIDSLTIISLNEWN